MQGKQKLSCKPRKITGIENSLQRTSVKNRSGKMNKKGDNGVGQ